MRQNKRGSWWGLYALMLVMAALLYLAHQLRVGQAVHEVLLLAVVVVVAYLTLQWLAKHGDLMDSEGAQARSEQDLAAARYAPPLTATQASYRQAMQARGATDANPGRKAGSVDLVRHLGDDDAGLEQESHPQN